MSVFVGGILSVFGSSLMLHVLGVSACTCGIMFAIKAISIDFD